MEQLKKITYLRQDCDTPSSKGTAATPVNADSDDDISLDEQGFPRMLLSPPKRSRAPSLSPSNTPTKLYKAEMEDLRDEEEGEEEEEDKKEDTKMMKDRILLMKQAMELSPPPTRKSAIKASIAATHDGKSTFKKARENSGAPVKAGVKATGSKVSVNKALLKQLAMSPPKKGRPQRPPMGEQKQNAKLKKVMKSKAAMKPMKQAMKKAMKLKVMKAMKVKKMKKSKKTQRSQKGDKLKPVMDRRGKTVSGEMRVKLRPHGCSKCRHAIVGCTPSCWSQRVA